MPTALTHLSAGFTFATSDAQAVGIVTWIGLLVTIAGFWIAIAQIRRVDKATQAATIAVAKLAKVVRSQEQNAKITDALRHLTSAQAMIKQNNVDATAAYLSVGWAALVQAYELTEEVADRESIGEYVLSTRRLLDDIADPATSLPSTGRLSSRRHIELSRTLSGLGVMSARLNAALSGIGTRV